MNIVIPCGVPAFQPSAIEFIGIRGLLTRCESNHCFHVFNAIIIALVHIILFTHSPIPLLRSFSCYNSDADRIIPIGINYFLITCSHYFTVLNVDMRIIRSALAGRAAFQPVEHKCIHIMFKSDIPIGTTVRLSYHFHDMRCRRFLCMASSCNHGCFVRPIRLSSVLYRFYAAHNAIPMLGGCFIYHGIMGCHQCSHVTMGSSRMMRDSNPRNLSVHLFSRQAPSTTRTIIQFVQQVQ